MGASVVRFETAQGAPQWGVLQQGAIHPLQLPVQHQAELISVYQTDRNAFQAAIDSQAISEESRLLSPLCAGTQLFAQGLNYAEHVAESGLQPLGENLIFAKASSSLSGPSDPIVRPHGCQLLDYEIELGIVLSRDIRQQTSVDDDNLDEFVGALVLCNDVSARDDMFGAPMLQWFKGKGHRTFCPAGPVLYLLDAGDLEYLYRLQLTLKLNGETKQQAVTAQLIHKPPKTLTDISSFADLNAGDCVLTGTPGGVLAGHSPEAGLAIITNFADDQKRRVAFVEAQQAQTRFLQPGDLLELSIVSDDGCIDLGTQRNEIMDAVA